MFINKNDGSNIHIVLNEVRVGRSGYVFITEDSDDLKRHLVEVCAIADRRPSNPCDWLEYVGADWGSEIEYEGKNYYVGVREV